MSAIWTQDSSLEDMRNRLEKLRADQTRHKVNDDIGAQKDTLKILQSKFGSPVYDPTSPSQIAYRKTCERTGRRKSIEFEDLYMSCGSGKLRIPPGTAGGVTTASRKPTTSLRTPSTTVLHHHHLEHATANHHPQTSHFDFDTKQQRLRKSSDPIAGWRRMQRVVSHDAKSDVAQTHGGHQQCGAVERDEAKRKGAPVEGAVAGACSGCAEESDRGHTVQPKTASHKNKPSYYNLQQ